MKRVLTLKSRMDIRREDYYLWLPFETVVNERCFDTCQELPKHIEINSIEKLVVRYLFFLA